MGSIRVPDMNPLVSIIVPCMNEDPKILTESLVSIRNQTYKNFECILVDESTYRYISDFCESFCKENAVFIYIHPEKRIGLAASLNLGIKVSSGGLIARFDSDDICRRAVASFQRVTLMHCQALASSSRRGGVDNCASAICDDRW